VYGTSIAKLFENPALDTVLRGGDRVIVEAEERFFLSLGAANSQSVHLFPKDHVTALDALAIVGGVEETRADPQGILVLRQYPQRALRRDGSGPGMDRVVFTLDLTSADGLFSAGQFHIESGDLVYATESPLSTARTIFGLIGSGAGILNDLR
jgi:polysaccharide export outer membrane protein